MSYNNNDKMNKWAILKALTALTIVIIIVTITVLQDFDSTSRILEKQTLFVLESICECRRWEKIVVVKNANSTENYSGNALKFYILILK